MIGLTEPELDISCHQMKLLAPSMGLISTSCWPKGSLGNPQTTQATAKVIGGSLQANIKVLLLRTMPTQLSKHGKAALSM